MNSTPLVIDASVAISWLYPSQTTTKTELLKNDLRLGAHYCAPDVLRNEVAYVLWRDFKRKNLNPAQAKALWDVMLDLPLQYIKGNASHYASMLTLSLKHNISTFDAAYISLAQESDAVLATRDKAMSAAAKQLSIETYLC